ncbi:MAG: hypothetical protein JWR83_1865 [Aeromicrobium sp.]|nr:hypothetical protein [Aeromicrobium sp.]
MRSLVTGRPSGQGEAPKAVGHAGIPGRWLRVVDSPVEGDHQLDREVSDPTEAAAVRAQWLLVDAYERLSRPAARQVFQHDLRAWHQYADDTIAVLNHRSSADSMVVSESKINRLRYRRTMDFAQAGDRVFDVGFGRGYLAAQLIKERDIATYYGIDVVRGYLPSARALFEANGLADASIELEFGDLFELTREKVESTGANLMICCEVLEHVDDAEKALRTLADALPEGADLLFSVPLHGRIESTWGHLSVFDVARLKQMLDGAGLHAHHVEPLANSWTLVVASRSPELSQRVREASGRPSSRVSVPLVRHRTFVRIPADQMTVVGASKRTQIQQDGKDSDKVICRVASGGGVSFRVDGIEAVRVLFDMIEFEHVTRFDVTAFAGSARVGEWSWVPRRGQLHKGVQRFAMRPGEKGRSFVSGAHHDIESADRVEVTVQVAAGATAEFGFKSAYLP